MMASKPVKSSGGGGFQSGGFKTFQPKGQGMVKGKAQPKGKAYGLLGKK